MQAEALPHLDTTSSKSKPQTTFIEVGNCFNYLSCCLNPKTNYKIPSKKETYFKAVGWVSES